MLARRALVAFMALGFAAPALGQSVSAAPAAGPAYVRFDTSAGPFVLEIETDKAPITSKQFLHYVDAGRFSGRKFYRVVKVGKEYGFVEFGMDSDPKLVLPPIAHEPTTETGIHNVDGTISIARLDPGTAQGEFSIVLGDQRESFDADPSKPGDNQGYAAFGHIVSGRETLVTILDSTIDPEATDRGSFKGQVPAEPVTIASARRIAAPPPESAQADDDASDPAD